MLKSTILAAGLLLMSFPAFTETSINNQRAMAQTTNVSIETDAEISEYIEGQTGKGQAYQLYDLIVNKADMSTVKRDFMRIGVDCEYVSCADGINRYRLMQDETATVMFENESYTLEAGKFYIIVGAVDGYCYDSEDELMVNEQGKYMYLQTYPASYATWIGTTQKAIQYLTNIDVNTVPAHYIGLTADATCLYENEANDITVRISDNWKNRLTEIGVSGLTYDSIKESKPLSLLDADEAIFIAPYEDTVLNFEHDKFEAKKGFMLNIYSFDVNGLADMKKPEFNLNNYYFAVDVNNPLSIETIFELIKLEAWDETDGDLTSKIKLESTSYDPNNIKVGAHEVLVSVTDKSGNRSEARFYIQVVDNDKPQISGTLEYRVPYNNPIAESAIRQSLTISDNYDTDLVLELISDTYTPNQNQVGNYQLAYSAKDSSGNQTAVIVSVEVYDDIAPVIAAPQTIEISTALCLTDEDILSKIKVSDEHDGYLIPTIEDLDDYANQYSVVGEYRFRISAVDSSGNEQEFIVTVKTNDSVAPEFWADINYFIVVEKGTVLSDEKILSFLVQTGQVIQEEVITLSHNINYNKAGTYPIKATLKNGEIKTFYVAVTEKEQKQKTNYVWVIPTAIGGAGIVTGGIVLIYKMKKRKGQ